MAMTSEEFNQLEEDLIKSGQDNKSYLTTKGIKLNEYYYWKRKTRESKEAFSQPDGQFLPIDIYSGGLMKSTKRGKSIKQPLIGQGEIEIELRTPSGAEFRIRGIMDSLMVSTIITSSGGRRNV